MTRTIIIAALALVLHTGCGGDTCGHIEEQLDRCGQSYYGDDNCELLLDGCDGDDVTIVEAMFECLGDACEGQGNAASCDAHFARLSASCQTTLTGG